MLKMFEYRIYPTKGQARAMLAILEECRWLYNHLLEQRKASFEQDGKTVSLFEQSNTYPLLKKQRPSLEIVHSQVLQNVATRLDLAYKAFFRRVKAGEKPGFPHFKAFGRYDSFTYPQVPSGCNIRDGKLYLSKIGLVKVVLHRPLGGPAKTCTIRRSSTGKWYTCFACECEPRILPASPEQVGIDVGLKVFAALSTGQEIENPRFFRTEEKSLAKAQRCLSRAEKGTKNRTKRKKVVARIHERIAWRRGNFTHQESRKIVNAFGLIAVEDIYANRLVHNHCLAKSILDAAWSEFFSKLSYKAAEAMRQYIAVNPAYTSQTCSRCKHRQPMPLSERVFQCPCCGLEIDRDLNAALNILALGLQCLGMVP